ncbi:glycosyltransferase family 4 protein [Haloarcula sediminis]|uniref:glycosyltransferase family 4 protein n=1 Tax=Haloarcula sediminis TaxID=3111777 RepID=UPI002D764AE8|nr:glycosyltransferase family 4 protein [Haloarcula sp. CK38]
MKELNIAVVHNKIRDYRNPLFRKISENYNTDFYIFDGTEDSYPYNAYFLSGKDLFLEIARGDYDVVILPDFVFKHAWLAGSAAVLSGAGIVSWTEVWDMPHTKFSKTMMKRLLAFGMGIISDTFVVPGKKSEDFIKKSSFMKSSVIFTAPNAPYLPGKEQSVHKYYDISGDKEIVLFLGRLIEIKRVEDIIKAVDMIDSSGQIQLLIGGEGEEEYTESLKAISNADITNYLGWVPREHVKALYELSDVYVLPSLTDAYPLTVVEAMSVGTPVVISEGVGEAGDIVRQGETGEIVPTKSPEALADAIKKILTNPKYAERLSAKGKKVVSEEATYEKMLQGFSDAIERATE